MSDEAAKVQRELTAEERDLGMDRDITRRDFLNTVALGTGAALLGAPAPASLVPRSRPSAGCRRTRRRRGIR